MTRRGFALPLVVMLTAVLGIVVGFMLSRQSVQQLTIERQIDSYREHHVGKGVRELIDAFTKTARGRDPSQFIAPDGRVFDIRAEGGTELSVYLFDGQGQLLNPAASGGDRLNAQMLAANAAPGEAARTYGPTQVSVNSASPEALTMAGNLASEGKLGPSFSAAVLSARASKPIPAEGLQKIAEAVGFTPEQLVELRKYITSETQIWNVEARLQAGAGVVALGARPERVFTGHLQLGGQSRASAMGGASLVAVWSKTTTVHDWKEVRDPKPRVSTER